MTTMTRPGGELLLGLPTLLTMHRVNAEVKQGTRMIWGTRKASQRVNASIRHMHREHSAYSNATCALRAPFSLHTFHSCFHLCRAREMSAQTPN